MKSRTILICLLAGLSGCTDQVPETHISAPPALDARPMAETPVERYPERVALFGDLHVHTSWSVDAYGGENRLGPNSAYRFARGEQIELPNGNLAQLTTPLDFVALTDHAEGFSTHLVCTIPGEPEFDTEACRIARSLTQDELLELALARGIPRPALRPRDLCEDEARCLENARTTWQKIQAIANAHNEPGRFTALIGYEFSSLLPDFGMLHRNVIFRGTEVVDHAISSQDVSTQRELFARLDSDCVEPCKLLTIPHNTNFSWGLTFSRTDEDRTLYSAADLQRRSRIERLFEITQQKGTAECQLGVGTTDEDCNFGIMFPPCTASLTTRCVEPASFLRNILLDGLALGEDTALNPYKLGVIGSTDTHTSDPGNTQAVLPPLVASSEGWSFAVNRVLELDHLVIGAVRKMSAGGLAGVWAEANTRADIFDALHRRETFATSGSRMRIRFFAGGLPEDMEHVDDPVTLAYARGVPMGTDLPTTQSPRFWVWAARDPNGSGLDRIQIIKGWIEAGEPHEKVWDLACAGGRKPDDEGRCPETTAGVDLKTCETTGEPGAALLQTTFSDPTFSPAQPAFYYVRVLENPRCRWTTVLANSADVDPPTDVPATVQDRGWSSPIWVASP